MRIWSLNPEYLDSKGLVALWRETLLAKNVLEGLTRGYRNHPQLNRFRNSGNPLNNINYYLEQVYIEAENRGYRFNRDKFRVVDTDTKLTVTSKQIDYERDHLLKKLEKRDKELFEKVSSILIIKPHPLFRIIEGEVEDWEVM